MFKKIVFLLLPFTFLYAYELPKVDLGSSKAPKIVLFNATSVIVENKPSYILKWKTINATNVKITYIGKVKTSGEMTITDQEYNKSPITLKAFSKDNSQVDTVTINNIKTDLPPPIKFAKPKKEEGFQPYYQSPSLYRRVGAPILHPHQRRYY